MLSESWTICEGAQAASVSRNHTSKHTMSKAHPKRVPLILALLGLVATALNNRAPATSDSPELDSALKKQKDDRDEELERIKAELAGDEKFSAENQADIAQLFDALEAAVPDSQFPAPNSLNPPAEEPPVEG